MEPAAGARSRQCGGGGRQGGCRRRAMRVPATHALTPLQRACSRGCSPAEHAPHTASRSGQRLGRASTPATAPSARARLDAGVAQAALQLKGEQNIGQLGAGIIGAREPGTEEGGWVADPAISVSHARHIDDLRPSVAMVGGGRGRLGSARRPRARLGQLPCTGLVPTRRVPCAPAPAPTAAGSPPARG